MHLVQAVGKQCNWFNKREFDKEYKRHIYKQHSQRISAKKKSSSYLANPSDHPRSRTHIHSQSPYKKKTRAQKNERTKENAIDGGSGVQFLRKIRQFPHNREVIFDDINVHNNLNRYRYTGILMLKKVKKYNLCARLHIIGMWMEYTCIAIPKHHFYLKFVVNCTTYFRENGNKMAFSLQIKWCWCFQQQRQRSDRINILIEFSMNGLCIDEIEWDL